MSERPGGTAKVFKKTSSRPTLVSLGGRALLVRRRGGALTPETEAFLAVARQFMAHKGYPDLEPTDAERVKGAVAAPVPHGVGDQL